MYISFNASAVIANNSLNKTDHKLQDALARLSSGLKVVNPKDNPSGLAMARRMNAQIEGTSQANNNASDGISVIEIADGAMNEIHDMLQRMNELAIKGANGTMTSTDRSMINSEMQQLKEEIARVGKETSFNGQKILDGSFDLKGYVTTTGTNTFDKEIALDTKVAFYSDQVTYGNYAITNLNVAFSPDGTIAAIDENPAKKIQVSGFSNKITATYSGNTVSLKDDTGKEIKLEVHNNNTGAASINYDKMSFNLTGIGSMDMQIGANEGQQLNIRIPKISLENMGIANTNVESEEYANEAINQIKDAMKYVSSARSGLGAYQNRLEHTIKSLDVTEENMTAAYSRIMDVDMAEEMTNYTTLQVLSQASTSMLAQANERPSQVLQLLQ